MASTSSGVPHTAIAKQHDSTIMKVIEETAPVGPSGEKYLASGRHVGMRLWRLQPHIGEMPTHTRDYEVVGYVISGRASLFLGGSAGSSDSRGSELKLEAGMSYCVPRGTPHRWHIEAPLVAIEGTSPVCFVHDRDARIPSASSAVGAGIGAGSGAASSSGLAAGGTQAGSHYHGGNIGGFGASGSSGIDTSDVKVFDTGSSVSSMPTVGVSQSASDAGGVSGVTPFTSGKIVSGTGQQPGLRILGSDVPTGGSR